jgi:hypothetical protein
MYIKIKGASDQRFITGTVDKGVLVEQNNLNFPFLKGFFTPYIEFI